MTQASIIKEYFFRNIRNIPVFLAGDFNDFPWSRPVRFLENTFVDLFTIGSNQHKYPANHPSVKATYPDYTLICDTNTFGTLSSQKSKFDLEPSESKKPEKPALEYRCLDYLMVLRNSYLE